MHLTTDQITAICWTVFGVALVLAMALVFVVGFYNDRKSNESSHRTQIELAKLKRAAGDEAADE